MQAAIASPSQPYAASNITAAACCAESRVLYITLLKRNRKGHYLPGTTNADTFWPALLAAAPPTHRLIPEGAPPPTEYFFCEYDAEDLPLQPAAAQALPAVASRRAALRTRAAAAGASGSSGAGIAAPAPLPAMSEA